MSYLKYINTCRKKNTYTLTSISLLFTSFINVKSNYNRAKCKNITSKEDCQKNKLNKHCSKFPSKTLI